MKNTNVFITYSLLVITCFLYLSNFIGNFLVFDIYILKIRVSYFSLIKFLRFYLVIITILMFYILYKKKYKTN